MSACCRLLSFWACSSRASCRRAISSLDRKRVSGVRRFRWMPRAGLVSMCPQATAKFMICRKTPRLEFARPGADRLYSSNQRLTCAGAMRSIGFEPKAGSMRPARTDRTPFLVEGL